MSEDNIIDIQLSPTDYQRDILTWANDEDIKYISMLKSRQSGGSYVLKMLVTLWGLSLTNAKMLYICPTNKLSKTFFRELTEALGQFIKSTNATDLFVKFATGSSLQFLSAEGTIRGFQGTHVIIDEAAFITDEVFNYSIRATFLITGKKVVMVSTPAGSQGFFFDYVNRGLDKTPHYITKSINIFDNPFVTEEEIMAIKAQVPEKVFRQEYLAEFLDANGAVFSNWQNCIYTKPYTRNPNDTFTAAIDWASENDFTVLTIVNQHKKLCYLYRVNHMEYTEIVKIIATKLNEWRPTLTISEENNIGTVVNELLKKQYRGRIKCITLGNTFKKEMIENLIVAFETETIQIPEDENLIKEIKAFSCTYNPTTKTVKYAGASNFHDDCIISLAYSYYYAKNNNVGGSYIC